MFLLLLFFFSFHGVLFVSYNKRSQFEPLHDGRANLERVRDMTKHMEKIWQTVRDQISIAQRTQQHYANQHRRPVNFTAGDSVRLSLESYTTDRPSKRLDHQVAGPLRIVEQVGHSFRLELLSSMKIHPVISPDMLRKAGSDPVPGQHPDPPPPITIQGDNEWEAEEVLTSRLSLGKLQYRVKWLGFDHDGTWYPSSNFQGSPHLLRDFHRQYPDRPDPQPALTNGCSHGQKVKSSPMIMTIAPKLRTARLWRGVM